MTSQAFILIVWLSGAAAVIGGGVLPDGYSTYSLHLPDPQPYPISGVAQMLAVVSFQSAMVWAIIRPQSYVRSWSRSLIAFVVTAASAGFFGMWLMHAPPFRTFHFLWLAVVSLALLVTSIVSGVAVARNRDAS